MAHLFCKFLDFRSPSTNYYYKSPHLLSPSNNSSSIAPSFSSTVVTKTRRKPLFCKPASPAIDLISTHEHHDGSVLFRFGDPSEIVENIVLEKPTSIVDEEVECESAEESSVDDGSEVVIDKTETEADGDGYGLTELKDELQSVQESSVVQVLDGDDGSDDVIDKTEIEANSYGLTEVTEELESVQESSVVQDLDGKYESDVVIDKTEIETNGYGSTELSDELDPDVSGTKTIASVDRFDESSDSEGESSDSEDELPVSTLSMEMEVSYNAGPDIESVTSDQEFLEDSSLSSVSVIDDVSEMGSTMMTAELLEKKIDDDIILQKGSLDLGSSASQASLETDVSTDKSVSSELQNVDAEVKNETVEDGMYNGASMETAVADDPVNSELQSVDVELKNETAEDGKDCGASSLETLDAVNESLTSELQFVDQELNNETIECGTDGQSSSGAVIVRDESVSPELQIGGMELSNETTEYGTEINTTDLLMNSPEVAQNSTDVSVNSGFERAEKETEILQNDMDTDSSEMLSDSSEMQIDASLLEEAEYDNLELPMQSVVAGDGSESNMNYVAARSPELEEAINLSPGVDPQTSENARVIANEIVQDKIENDPMEPTSVSPILETETVEEYKKALSAEVDPQTSENEMGIRKEILQNEVESYVMKSASASPTLETESNFQEAMGEKAIEFEENEAIGDDGSEHEAILLMPESPQEEAESINYEVTTNGVLEEFQDDDRVESPTVLNKVPEDLILEKEATADDDSVQINQLPGALRDDVTRLESTDSTANRKEVMPGFVLSSGAALLPHPSKVLAGGEDAYFVAGQTWLGVADGVVQWSLEGRKPGVYAHELIRNCEKIASDCKGNSISFPVDLLKASVAELPSSGYSTVLIAHFDGQALHVANVGDSGFIILRHGTVYKRSSPMLHAFHFPLLFGKEDEPSHVSELYDVDLEEDDVIIIATDGLFDNLYDQEILSIVMKSFAAELKLEDIAALLAKKAQDVGGSTTFRSPFADSAQAAGYAGYTGGKLDDVTVIVSIVKRQSSSQTV